MNATRLEKLKLGGKKYYAATNVVVNVEGLRMYATWLKAEPPPENKALVIFTMIIFCVASLACTALTGDFDIRPGSCARST